MADRVAANGLWEHEVARGRAMFEAGEERPPYPDPDDDALPHADRYLMIARESGWQDADWDRRWREHFGYPGQPIAAAGESTPSPHDGRWWCGWCKTPGVLTHAHDEDRGGLHAHVCHLDCEQCGERSVLRWRRASGIPPERVLAAPLPSP